MTTVKSFVNNRIDRWARGRLTNSAFSSNIGGVNPLSNMVFGNNKPAWIALKTPEDFENAARFNPIVKSAINLLATSASNGKKVLIDSKTGEVIDWNDQRPVVKKLKQLFLDRPNPLQSAKEFTFQGKFYLKTFGNRMVYALMPTGLDKVIDVLNIDALWNLPSQYMTVRKTGKIYKQKSLNDIISSYAQTNVQPIELYPPEHILHFNEVNISSEEATIMGISKLESLRRPISNIQAVFEAINTLLVSGGAKGIIAIDSKDGQGTIVPLQDKEKKEVQKTFKEDYGLLGNQNPFLISPVPLTFTKTAMTSKELGIYEELSNNAILISNEYGIPRELLQTFSGSATYENQIQSVRRLYQDTTIPETNDDDQYWNYRLNLEQYGVRLITTWDHIPVLQDAFKEKALSINLKGRTAKEAYNENIITWNQYLEMIELDTVPDGDVLKHERKLTNDDTNNNQE